MNLEEEIKELSDRLESVEKENQKLRKKNKEIENRNLRLEKNLKPIIENKDSRGEEKISRRSFIKKVGAGVAGISAFGLSSTYGLKLTETSISTTSGIDFVNSGTDFLNKKDGEAVDINTNLDMNGNSILNASQGSFNPGFPNDVTSSRSTDTWYTNNTGSPLHIRILRTSYNTGSGYIKIYMRDADNSKTLVDREGDRSSDTDTSGNSGVRVMAIVPEGAEYRHEGAGFDFWLEQKL